MKIQITNSAGTFKLDGGDINQEGLEKFVEEIHKTKIVTIDDVDLGLVTFRKELLVNSAWRLIP